MKTIRTSAGSSGYRWNWDEFGYLVHVLEQAKDFKSILNAYIDLHTQKELAEAIRRVIIASYLDRGMTYEEIAEATGASHNTISRISIKMMRQNSILPKLLKSAGTFDKYRSRTKQKPSLIDNTLNKYNPFKDLK